MSWAEVVVRSTEEERPYYRLIDGCHICDNFNVGSRGRSPMVQRKQNEHEARYSPHRPP